MAREILRQQLSVEGVAAIFALAVAVLCAFGIVSLLAGLICGVRGLVLAKLAVFSFLTAAAVLTVCLFLLGCFVIFLALRGK